MVEYQFSTWLLFLLLIPWTLRTDYESVIAGKMRFQCALSRLPASPSEAREVKLGMLTLEQNDGRMLLKERECFQVGEPKGSESL